jgi:murein tripeptide amidase MpaA
MRQLLLLALVFAVAVGRISHEGEYIVRCRYKEGSAIHALQTSQVDVQGVLADNYVDVRVQRPEDQEAVDKYLTNCQVVVEDLEKLTQEVERQNQEALLRDDPVWFSAYRNWDDLRSWYYNQSTRFPNLVRFYDNIHPNRTNTPGGRQIWAISIFNYANPSPRLKAWHTAGIHAREWVAPSTLNYIADQLISRYNARDDQIVTDWVNNVETWIVGSLNPDGYVFSWTNNRQWRKNRKNPPSGSTCFGVDCNRNFPDHWGQGGSSTNPCDDTYMGTSAGSEVEVAAVVGKFREITGTPANSRIILAIDWHSYSQLFLRPYGWTNTLSPDENRFVTLGNAYVADIRATSGLTYTSQRSIQLYVTTGSAGDWYYGASNPSGTNRTAAWTVELRPTGSNPGFVLPPDQITPTGNENWRALRNLMQSVRTAPLP